MDLEQSEDSSSGLWSFLQPSLPLTPHLMHTFLRKITYLVIPHYLSLILFVLPPHTCPMHPPHQFPFSKQKDPAGHGEDQTHVPCHTSNPTISLPASRRSLSRQHATKLRTPFRCFPINPAAGGCERKEWGSQTRSEGIPAWGDASPCSSRLSRALLF